MSRGRVRTLAPAFLFLFMAGLFVWMLTRPFENYFGNDEGGSVEVFFGTPLSRTIYAYYPDSGRERLEVSNGIWDQLEMEVKYQLGGEASLDFSEYEIRDGRITGNISRRFQGETILSFGIMVPNLPPRAQRALEESRAKARQRWPNLFARTKPVLTSIQ